MEPQTLIYPNPGEDIFNSSLNLEETHFNEGFKQGFDDGFIAGKQEARDVGLKVGFEIGEELGFYRGCIDVWSSEIRVDPSCFSIRVQKSIKQLEELIEKYPIFEPEHECVEEVINGLRLKFRAVVATLSLKLDFEGYPKLTEASGTEF
ncbi:hypothetical protein GIB67_042867 [Kingdonia uniflora]|uniref:Essential protein Yae1 N-terminal domain-containing protein n=1 Tax=Kingdonia uniflora TaxID=39325 RepID=A0A7J7NSW0_9MAGN|nr:hypothetical protein GIB67_042867 [Kingdonia uniflora]